MFPHRAHAGKTMTLQPRQPSRSLISNVFNMAKGFGFGPKIFGPTML